MTTVPVTTLTELLEKHGIEIEPGWIGKRCNVPGASTDRWPLLWNAPFAFCALIALLPTFGDALRRQAVASAVPTLKPAWKYLIRGARKMALLVGVRDEVIKLRDLSPCATLKKIGDQVGVSRERVRQILVAKQKPTRHWKPKRYCSKCGTEIVQRRNGNWPKFCSRKCRISPEIPVSCDYCDKVFYIQEKNFIWHNNHGQEHWFCSESCRSKYVSKNCRKRKYNYDEIISLYNKGLTYRQINTSLNLPTNVSENIIYNLRKKGIDIPSHGNKGFTKYDLGLAKNLLYQGLTVMEIVSKTGIPYPSVYRVFRNIKHRR